MTVIVAESGEYEQRGVEFVAVSAEAALEHLKQRHPEKTWQLIDRMVHPAPDAPHGGFTPYRDWFIESDDAATWDRWHYELSEEEVIS